jgi:hypothetical protein
MERNETIKEQFMANDELRAMMLDAMMLEFYGRSGQRHARRFRYKWVIVIARAAELALDPLGAIYSEWPWITD